MIIKKVVSKINKDTDLEVKSVEIDGRLKLKPHGHHLASEATADGTEKLVYAATITDENGGSSTISCVTKATEIRIITHGNATDKSGLLSDGAFPEVQGDYTHEFTGTEKTYNAVPIQNYIFKGIRYKTGSLAAECPVRVHFYYGTTQNQDKIYFDETFPASYFPANSEVLITLPDVDYPQGQELHGVLTATEIGKRFSLMMNADLTIPWRAVDRQQYEHEQLLNASLIYAPIKITSPLEGQTGISLTPTVSTSKGIAKHMSWHATPNFTSYDNSPMPLAATITIPPNSLGANGILKGSLYLSTNTPPTGDPLVLITFGGVQSFASARANTDSVMDFEIIALDATHQRMAMRNNFGTMQVSSHTADLSVEQDIRININAGIDAGSITLVAYDLQLTNNESDYIGIYNQDKTELQVLRSADQTVVHTGESTGLSHVVTTSLKGSTQHQVRARHKTAAGLTLPWSGWQAFKTLMDLTINTGTGMTAGNLVEFDIGESVNSTGFDFHLSGLSDKFPSAAFDSGEFRFKDSGGTDLLFKVQSVVGVAPNRTAKCYVETNAQVISDSKIKLIGVGAGAANVSQVESAWFVPWTPANLTGSYRWLDAADISQGADTAVPSWTSKGTVTIFAEELIANQPYVKSTLVNGNKMLHFGGADDSLTATMDHLASTDHNIYMMWEPKSLTENHDLFGYWESLTGSVLLMDMTNSGIRAHVREASNSATSPLLSKPSIVGQRFNRTARDLWAIHNGVLAPVVKVVADYTGGGTKTYGICGKTRNSGTEYANGYVGDTIITTYDLGDPSLGTTDAGKLTGYLAHKYAITADLAEAHPYKTVAPTILGKTIHVDKFVSVA